MYIFFPIGWMYYFGTNLDQRFSVPDFWPKKNETNTIPFEREDIAEELKRLKTKRLEARERRMRMQAVEGEEEGAQGFQDERAQGSGGHSAMLKSLGNADKAPVVSLDEGMKEDKKKWFGLW